MAKGNAARSAKTAVADAARDDARPARASARRAAAPGTAPDLDQQIHEHVRLRIVSALAVNDMLSFTELKALLQASDGNLSVHARKLEDAGYVASTKGFAGRMPRTDYRLTAEGRRALARYLDHMESLIRATRAR